MLMSLKQLPYSLKTFWNCLSVLFHQERLKQNIVLDLFYVVLFQL